MVCPELWKTTQIPPTITIILSILAIVLLLAQLVKVAGLTCVNTNQSVKITKLAYSHPPPPPPPPPTHIHIHVHTHKCTYTMLVLVDS